MKEIARSIGAIRKKQMQEDFRGAITTKNGVMNMHGSIITEQEREQLEKFSQQEERETQSSDSIQPYFHSKEDLEITARSLDESKAQTRQLMEDLAKSQAPHDRQLLVRCAKEIRETLKVKLELAKFAHVISPKSLVKKEIKETA